MSHKALFVIPARAGSKGLPDKNKKILRGKPLIAYTIEEALKVTSSSNVIVSSDDEDILEIARQYGLLVPFKRPESLAQDHSSSREVLLHAVDFFQDQGRLYESVVMLQPTSPLRTADDISGAIQLYSDDTDCVVSVFQTKSNPYFVLFEENEEGFLVKSKNGFFQRRQDCPPVFELNGAVYVINIAALRSQEITQMERIMKYIMPKERSLDIDTEFDFLLVDKVIEMNHI